MRTLKLTLSEPETVARLRAIPSSTWNGTDTQLRRLLTLGLSPEKAAERVPGATTADAARVQRAMQAARTGTPTEGAAAIKAGRA